MVSFDAGKYEIGVANRLCINPYELITTTIPAPYSELGKSQSIVLPIILVILAIIFCLGCVVGIPVVAYLYKSRNENKDFTDINQIPDLEDDN
jgi:hypothetical protein